VAGYLSLELSEATERSRDQSPKPVLNIVNVGEGAPTVVKDVPRPQAIEHKPTPVFEMERSSDKLEEEVFVPAEKPQVTDSPPAAISGTSNEGKPVRRFRPEADAHD
jgi:hypothetical protein